MGVHMKISGLQKLSLVDFDGHTATTIFTAGCNFACPFCHNSSLVIGNTEDINEQDIIDYLHKRQKLIDAVVISGGEPTLHSDLPLLIKKIKELGFLIKLDTNGTNTDMVKYLVENRLVDYIAMDIKNSIIKYPATTGKDINMTTIQNTINYIMNCGIDYEFRTTLVAEYHNIKDFENICQMIGGAKKYYLQKFVDSGECIQSGLHEVAKSDAQSILEYVQKYIPNTKLRGY